MSDRADPMKELLETTVRKVCAGVAGGEGACTTRTLSGPMAGAHFVVVVFAASGEPDARRFVDHVMNAPRDDDDIDHANAAADDGPSGAWDGESWDDGAGWRR